jgi:hypothetical protein
MVETQDELVDRLRLEHGVTVQETETDPESGLTMSDRAKLAATGLLFNYADEAIAGIKALSPNVTYEDALAGERKQIKAAQAKDGSLKYEIGGALIPAVASAIAAPFTGGTSLATTAPTWMRLLGIGAAQGLAAGTGASEREGLARLADAPTAVVTGAVANPLLAKLSQAAQAALSPLLDSARRYFTGKIGKKVEDELIRMIEDSGLTVDDFLEKVRGGQILPEMSEEAAKVVAGFASKAGAGSGIIRDAITGRKNRFVKDLYEKLQNDLDPQSQGGNIFKAFSDDTEKLLKAESDAYNAIWNATDGQVFQEIDDVVLALAKASKQSRAKIVSYFDDAGLPSPFKFVGRGDKGKLQLTRSLSLKEGELVKRAFMDAKDSASRSGAGNKANTMKAYETQVKNVLDVVSPDLQATRQNWAIINNAVKKFDEGKKVFAKNPEEFAVEFDKLVQAGETDAIEALRTGAASALKMKSQSSSATGAVTKLSDMDLGINQKERIILEILYPGDKLDDIIVKINQARGSIVASNRTFGGSQTAERSGSAGRVGVGQGLADVGRVVTSNGLDFGAAANIVTRMFGGKKPPFTNDQYKKIAQLVISEDANVLESALTDQATLDAVYRAFAKAINVVSSSQPRVQFSTGATEGIGDVFDPIASSALSALISTISPETANKIQKNVSNP